jgi:aspartate 1-decarboxylase
MLRPFLRATIDRARVTRCDADRAASITIDAQLLAACDVLPLERVEVHNLTQGTSFSSYCTPGAPGKGGIAFNGAMADLAAVGDLVVIAAYCQLDREDVPHHRARVVQVDDANRLTQVREYTPFDHPE